MKSNLSAAVRTLAKLYPAVRAGTLGAVAVVATCCASHAADPSAAETYRQGLLKVAASSSSDHLKNVEAMRGIAKSTLLAAKARHLDVDAPNAPGASDAAYYRQRLRGVLYADVGGMSPDNADDKLHKIATGALSRGGPDAASDLVVHPKPLAGATSRTTEVHKAAPPQRVQAYRPPKGTLTANNPLAGTTAGGQDAGVAGLMADGEKGMVNGYLGFNGRPGQSGYGPLRGFILQKDGSMSGPLGVDLRHIGGGGESAEPVRRTHASMPRADKERVAAREVEPEEEHGHRFGM